MLIDGFKDWLIKLFHVKQYGITLERLKLTTIKRFDDITAKWYNILDF